MIMIIMITINDNILFLSHALFSENNKMKQNLLVKLESDQQQQKNPLWCVYRYHRMQTLRLRCYIHDTGKRTGNEFYKQGVLGLWESLIFLQRGDIMIHMKTCSRNK